MSDSLLLFGLGLFLCFAAACYATTGEAAFIMLALFVGLAGFIIGGVAMVSTIEIMIKRGEANHEK